MSRPKLILIKGSATDTTSEINLIYGQLITRALFHKKEKESRYLQWLISNEEKNKDKHFILSELRKFDYLMYLPEPPFSYISNLNSFVSKDGSGFYPDPDQPEPA